jgi:hypothetical protein
MNCRRLPLSLLFALVLPAALFARPASDLQPADKRRPVVETAERLAKNTGPAPLPDEQINPFNPPAFGQPDPEEVRVASAPAAASSAPGRLAGDRDALAALAARITPSGTLTFGGESWLVFGRKRLRIGDHLTVTYEEHDYELELTAIDRTTFTLRLNREELTRPLKPGKSP